MKTRATLLILTLTLLAGCGQRKGAHEVHFNRFEQVLFSTPADQLQGTLRKELQTYSTPVLNVMPDNATYMQLLTGFVQDPLMKEVYQKTDSAYRDLGWLEEELGEALDRVPELQCNRCYTLISGDYEDYDHRVFTIDGDLAISIDRYTVDYGLPAYLANLCRRQYIATDCIATLAREQVEMPEGEPTLLDYMVAEGKTLYLVKQAMPKADDTLVMRYSGDQMRWIEKNLKQVWSWILQEELLFDSDLTQFHNLIDEAPKTNAFGDGSAPRTYAYIGLQIVSRYMKKSGATVRELLAETDSRTILNKSGWRP